PVRGPIGPIRSGRTGALRRPNSVLLDRAPVTPDPVASASERPGAAPAPHPALPFSARRPMSAEFGVARSVDAQSFGQPGQRTFRLRIIGEAQQSASLWMEKEQLQALSLALKQALGQLEYDREMPPRTIDDFPVVADHDFRIGRMGMGVNPGDTTVVLYLYELGTEDEDEPTLRVRFTPD